MALQANWMLGDVVLKKDAYWKIHHIVGDKRRVNVMIDAYPSADDTSNKLTTKAYTFVPDIDEDGNLIEDAPNFIKQAYTHLKTLPDFKDALDA